MLQYCYVHAYGYSNKIKYVNVTYVHILICKYIGIFISE